MSNAPPPGPPELTKQSSNPISIRKGAHHGGRGLNRGRNQAAAAAPMVSRSLPPMKFVPPAAPSARPRVPSMEPPPMNLPPPSPPVFNSADMDALIEGSRHPEDDFAPPQLGGVPAGGADAGAGAGARAEQPLSRSLKDYSWAMAMSSSMPHNFTMADFNPMGAVDESPEAEEAATAAAVDDERKAGGPAGGHSMLSASYNEGSTIYSMLRESSSLHGTPVSGTPVAPLAAGIASMSLGRPAVPARGAPRERPQASGRHANDSLDADDDGGLQFDISLDPNEESTFQLDPDESAPASSHLSFSGIN